MRISDWSSDLCSSDLLALVRDERSDAPVARSSADTMNGLLSHAPSPIAVRLAVGGLMLGQAQALILFAAPGPIAHSPRSLIVVLSLLSLVSIVGSIIGVDRRSGV